MTQSPPPGTMLTNGYENTRALPVLAARALGLRIQKTKTGRPTQVSFIHNPAAQRRGQVLTT